MAQIVLLIVVSFVASATGAVVVRRRQMSHVSLPVALGEVLVIGAGLLFIAAFRRPGSITYFLACALAMAVLGAVTAAATVARDQGGSGGTREFENFPPPERSTSVWRRWLSFTRSVADYEIRCLLVVCYLLVVGPIAIAHRLLGTAPARASSNSNWLTRNDTGSLDAARRSF
jgi:hypothetical protein